MKGALRTGASGAVLLLIMLIGSLVLWIGVPLGWLYVGSQVEGSTQSLGAAMAVMLVGVLASIAVLVSVLGWLSRKHGELRRARGLEDHGNVALEGVMTVSAAIAVVVGGGWFFLFSGSSPLPAGLGF